MIEVLIVSLVLIAMLDVWIIKQSHADKHWYAVLWRIGTAFEAVIIILGARMLAENPSLDGRIGAIMAMGFLIGKMCYIVYKSNRQKLYNENTEKRQNQNHNHAKI